MQEVKPLKQQQYNVRSTKAEVLFSEEEGNSIDAPRELTLPFAPVENSSAILAVQPRLDNLYKLKPKEQTKFLSAAAKKPSFYDIDKKIMEQENMLLDRTSLPPLKLAQDHVIKMCEKSHVISMIKTNPSLDTFLDRDYDISWSDLYDCLIVFP